MFHVKPKCAPRMSRSEGDEQCKVDYPMKMTCYKKTQQPVSQNKDKINHKIVGNEILNDILPLSPFPVPQKMFRRVSKERRQKGGVKINRF